MAEGGGYNSPTILCSARKYVTCMDIQARCEIYLEDCSERGVKATLTGLSAAIGISREDLLAYGKSREWGDVVNSYRTWVQQGYEEHLFNSSQVTGTIFALKNMGSASFSDNKTVQIDGNLTVSAIAQELSKALVDDVVDADFEEVQSNCVALPGQEYQLQSQSALQCDKESVIPGD